MSKKTSNYTDLATAVMKINNGKTQQEKMKDAAKIWNTIKTVLFKASKK